MTMPNFKVTITHNGTDTDYINEVFQSIQVKRRENNYDTATLTATDKDSQYYSTQMSKFDEIKIYFKNQNEAAYTQVFGGNIRQANPTHSINGAFLILNCKGYGAALEETHCNRDYGTEASDPTYPRPWDICKNVITDFTNKSFAGANTGYALVNTYITDNFATDIKYINNSFRTNLEVIDLVCELTSSIGAGTDAGAHWIVDNSKRLLIGKIGDHAAGGDSPETYWPDWWNTDQAGSTLTQGVDFTDYSMLDKNEEFANNVTLVTDFRRPSFDYWTEDSGGASLWGNDSLTSITDVNTAGLFVVGSHSVLFDPDGANFGQGYYPSTADAAWDITKWGSPRTIPTLNFYFRKHALTAGSTSIILSTNTTARKTDYFAATFTNWSTEADDTWFHKSLPIGPYWASSQESREFRWVTNPGSSPDWAKIDSVEFNIGLAGDGGALYVDDLHFSGKIVRSAIDSHSIAAYHSVTNPTGVGMELQKVLISRNSMDDSCVASDDSGFAGRIAYGELLRRSALPVTITFSVAGKPDMKASLAGQKLHVHACKKVDGSFSIDRDMRIIEIQHDLAVSGGYVHTVTATSDLKNSTPINIPDQYAMWQENIFLNSKEAKNIRSGAEVDPLISRLTKDYPS